MAKHIVTFAPPTPNGGLHVGHLSGPYLAADVYCRAFRLLGDEVLFVSYSDEYQSYLERKAKELQQDATQVADTNYHEISSALARCRIEPDCFPRSRDQAAFLKALKMFRDFADQYISLKTDQAPYCANCEHWGFEAYARGSCDHCGVSTDRSQCENCANAPEISGVSDMICVHCHQPVEYRAIDREFLNLDAFRPLFQDLAKRKGIRKPLADYLYQQLQLHSLDWPIDRPYESGAPCESAENTLLSTWFSGVSGYFGATDELGKASIWQDADHCSFFVGFDCSFSHALVYPALMQAANLDAVKDLRVYTNAFLKLDGMDFSTSRGVAIWANDLLNRVDADYIRFYLALFSPETESSNFKAEHFCQTINEQLHGPLQAWLIHAKDAQCGETLAVEDIQSWLEKWQGAISLQEHSMRKLAEVLMTWLDQKPYESLSTEQSLVALTTWALLAYPLMPRLSETLLLCAGLSLDMGRSWLTGNAAVPPVSQTGLSDHFKLPAFEMDERTLKSLYEGS